MQTTLILTASDETQACQFRQQLEKRERLDLLHGVREWRVIPDPPGSRVGSGGSTIHVLRELSSGNPPAQALAGRRVLIIHAGGESRRMPAYSVCGKVFCPIPGQPMSALPLTLFDVQLETYLELPQNPHGQITIFAGDVLLRFDPAQVELSDSGLIGVAAWESPEEASGHGVYADIADNGEVRSFLQKPSIHEMERSEALDDRGRAAIDLGVMSFTPDFADSLLEVADSLCDGDAGTVPALDFYTEIACCLPEDTDFDEYVKVVQDHGASNLQQKELKSVWDALHEEPFHCTVLDQCDFLHFGTSQDYLASAQRLSYENRVHATEGHRRPVVLLSQPDSGMVAGEDSVVEGTSLDGVLELAGRNVVAGAATKGDTFLREGVCLDVLPGTSKEGEQGYFHRLYGIEDTFKGSLEHGDCTYLNEPIETWVKRHGVAVDDVWPDVPADKRSLWNAKLFPFSEDREAVGLVLWMQREETDAEAKSLWMRQERYAMEEMSDLADGERFWQIRQSARRGEFWRDLPRSVDEPEPLSAADLAFFLGAESSRDDAISRLSQAYTEIDDPLLKARFLHTVGSAFQRLGWSENGVVTAMSESAPEPEEKLKLQEAAFDILREGMVASAEPKRGLPERTLRKDEIVWARSPVRLDVAGGWTDTPPYSLEHGGAVVNAAVDLNGQPPIQVFGRLSDEPHIILNSIDLGYSERVEDLDGLLDYQSPEGTFSIAKAALALCGFSPEFHEWPADVSLSGMLERFGGGIELTTLCAVPKGSGLGTSSILGATVLSAINRMTGTQVTEQDLFHQVLVLEQMLTTGGGWQDQIGGVLGGLKLVTTEPGMVPDPVARWLPAECLCPVQNGGCNLLYYTGITRLAKNILHNVVGRYLDRDRDARRTLANLKAECQHIRDALERRDREEFGATVARVWELNKALDPGSTNERVEELMRRIEPYASGAKLLGAGGGGFLLVVCPDRATAARCREDLESDPPNVLARFFDFQVNHRGLEVTVS